MKRIHCALVAVLSLVFVPVAIAWQAQSAPSATAAAEKLPAVEEILSHYVAALGGKQAMEKITSRVSKGSFELPELTGTIVMYDKAPNQSFSQTDLPGWGRVIRCFDGTRGWGERPDTGVQDFTDAEIAAAKRNTDFYREMHLEKVFPKMTVTGKMRMNGHDSYVVQGIADATTADTMYFDAATGLLFHVDSERTTSEGKSHVRNDLEDYRAVDGVKVPFLQRVRTDELEYTIKLTEVKQNTPIEETIFRKPAKP